MDPMADTVTLEAPEQISVPLWAWFVVAAAAFAVYLMTLDNTVLGATAERAHEFFHDARHFIGAPCH
jgi:hypothetical protein